MRIQEVAAETGLTPRSIRYYEEVGLLAPAARSEGAYRLYDAFSLAEIRQLLEDERARARIRARFRATHDQGERREMLVDAIARIDRQVDTLRQKIDRLQAMIGDAESRRAHLAGHLAEVEAGRELTQHDHAAMRR
jgi:DNA-binding transcriptional MerR regulator